MSAQIVPFPAAAPASVLACASCRCRPCQCHRGTAGRDWIRRQVAHATNLPATVVAAQPAIRRAVAINRARSGDDPGPEAA